MTTSISTRRAVVCAAAALGLTSHTHAQQSAFATPGMPTHVGSGQTDRFSSEFNPAIGGVIDALLDYRDTDGGEDGFDAQLRSFEATINGRVDPDWWAYAVIVGTKDDFGVEEAAAHYTGLDSNTTLRFGRFFADFGKQMQAHIHDLPYIDRPGVLAEYLGEELAGVGAQADHWWATGSGAALRASLGAFAELEGERDNDNGIKEQLADRRAADEFAFTLRVTQFMDVGERGVFQWGASARHLADFALVDEGNALEQAGLSNTVFGVDLTYGIDSESGLSGWTFGGEYLVATGDLGGATNAGLTAIDVEDNTVGGFYLWGERRFDVSNSAGILVGSYERTTPGAPRVDEFTAYVTHHMSEFARLRLAVTQSDSDDTGDETRVALQLTTFFGAHAHGVNW